MAILIMFRNLNYLRVAACAAVLLSILWMECKIAALIVGGVALAFLAVDTLCGLYRLAKRLYNNVRERVATWWRRLNG